MDRWRGRGRVADAIVAHLSPGDIVTLGLLLVACSFLGPGYPLLVLGAVMITVGGVLGSTRR